MKITQENLQDINYIYNYPNIEDGRKYLESLLLDIMELNCLLEDNAQPYKKIYLDYIDSHTEYSPERTEPCPDYYGMFTLKFEANPYETIGVEMTLQELDSVMCALINFTEFNLG